MSASFLPAVLACALLLTGCDRLGIEDPAKVAALKEAEGKAVGAACRHAGRAIEDCYSLNVKAQKAAVFSGWKEMNDYMRENKIDAVVPQIAAAAPKGGKPAEEDAKASEHADSPAQSDEPKQPKSNARSAKHG